PAMADQIAPRACTVDGGPRLPSVVVDSYNVETRDEDGCLGDRITKSAFCEVIDHLRKLLRKRGDDPLGDAPTKDLNKKTLDQLLTVGEPEAAGVVQSAIEDFAQDLALVIRRFLKLKGWRDTERIVIGGGMRASRVGELVIGRAAVILKSDKVMIDLIPICHDPDMAGLIGAAHLAPRWLFE